MIRTTMSAPPAGVFRAGSASLRVYRCAGALPAPVRPASGAALPASGVAALPASGLRFTDLAPRPRWTTAPDADATGTAAPGTASPAVGKPRPQHESGPMTTNDGTTPLGIHSPGRPTS